MGKVIVLTNGRTFGEHWASFAASRSEKTLLIALDPEAGCSASYAAENWVPRFKSLSPEMLRRFLSPDRITQRWMILSSLPPVTLLPDWLELLTQAFDWVILRLTLCASAEVGAVLDRSQALLTFIEPNASFEIDLQSAMGILAQLHVPHARHLLLLNRWPQDRVKPRNYSGKKVQGYFEEDDGSGLRWRQGMERLETLLRGEKSENPSASSAEAVERVKALVQPELARAMSFQQAGRLSAESAQKAVEACLAQENSLPVSRTERGEIVARVLDDVLGLGPLEPLLRDESITEIMVNGLESLYIERRGKLETHPTCFTSVDQLRLVIDRVVAPLGRRVDESIPLCDARLADGSRINIVLPPLSLTGPLLTIRKFAGQALTLHDLVALGALSQPMLKFLDYCVSQRKNLIVAGGTGSGKTTLLNALSSRISDGERIVTIEDAAELRLQKPHVVRLESRPPNAEGGGAITIRRLVMNALRMRPDRIVVGECRGGEALDMLQAMNTGHDGSMTTLHANSPRDALGRLETLVLMSGVELPLPVVREQIRSAVHIILQQARLPGGARKIISITEVTGLEGDQITTQELFAWKGQEFMATGHVPSWGIPL